MSMDENELQSKKKIAQSNAADFESEINPAAKILISSGYSDDPVMANYQDYGFKFAIKKPFRLHELGTAIKKVLSDNAETI